MKNLSLLSLSFILSLSVFSQEKLTVTVCEKSLNSINIGHLIECNLLSVDNPSYKVNSFTIGFKTGKDFIEVKMTDNVISDKIIDRIRTEKPKEIFIDDVILINKKGEKSKAECFKISQ